jgi:hypothetical protein
MNENKCICCPVEVRNLQACAHNLLTLFDGDKERLWCKLNEKLSNLKGAVETMQPLMDLHFALNHHKPTPVPPIQMVDGFPRRNRVDLATPAEKAIRDAIAAVEDAGASTALTESVTLLGRALDRLADHVERGWIPPTL